MLDNIEAPNLKLAADDFELEEVDRHVIRTTDERLNKFLYSCDPGDKFYYYDKDINSVDHGSNN